MCVYVSTQILKYIWKSQKKIMCMPLFQIYNKTIANISIVTILCSILFQYEDRSPEKYLKLRFKNVSLFFWRGAGCIIYL